MTKHIRVAKAAFSDLEAIHERLLDVFRELQESIDGKSERWQESEAGERAQAQSSSLESAISDVESAMGNLDEIGGDDE